MEAKGLGRWLAGPVLQSDAISYIPSISFFPLRKSLKQPPDIMLSNAQMLAMGLMFPSIAELEREAWHAE